MRENLAPAGGRDKQSMPAKKAAKKPAPNLEWHTLKATGGYTFVQKLNARRPGRPVRLLHG